MMNIDHCYAVLENIKGFSAQNSMPISVLAQKTGIVIEALLAQLEAMYARGMINRATITRPDITGAGLKELHLWPTGVLKHIDGVPDYVRALPRRDETPAKVEPAMQSTSVNGMPKALFILEYIEQNPDCTCPQIAKATQIEYPISYIKTAIKSGKVIVNKDNPRLCQYNLATGWTAATIYRKRAPNAAKDNEAIPPPPFISTSPTLTVASDEIDVFNPAVAVKHKIDTPAAEGTDAATYIANLLKMLPDDFEITLSKRGGTLIEIHGEMLSDSISVKLHEVNDTLDALKKLNTVAFN